MDQIDVPEKPNSATFDEALMTLPFNYNCIIRVFLNIKSHFLINNYVLLVISIE